MQCKKNCKVVADCDGSCKMNVRKGYSLFIAIILVLSLILFRALNSNAQNYICNYKQNEFNEWQQLSLPTEISFGKTDVQVKERDNTTLIILYDNIFTAPDGSNMYMWNKKVVAVRSSNSTLITIFKDNFLCPEKSENQ